MLHSRVLALLIIDGAMIAPLFPDLVRLRREQTMGATNEGKYAYRSEISCQIDVAWSPAHMVLRACALSAKPTCLSSLLPSCYDH
jgi:hypothetical protein